MGERDEDDQGYDIEYTDRSLNDTELSIDYGGKEGERE